MTRSRLRHVLTVALVAIGALLATQGASRADDGIFFRVVGATGGYFAQADTTWRWRGQDFDCHASATTRGSWEWTGHRRDGLDLDLRGRDWRRLNVVTHAHARSSGSNDCGRRPLRNGGAQRETFRCNRAIALHRRRGGAARLVGRTLDVAWDFYTVDARVDPCLARGGRSIPLDAALPAYDTNRMMTTVRLAHPLANAPLVITVRRPIQDMYRGHSPEYSSYQQAVHGEGSFTVTLLRGDLGGGTVSICGSAVGAVGTAGRSPAARASGTEHCGLSRHTAPKLRFASCQDFDAYRHAHPYLGEADWHVYGAYSFQERMIGWDVTVKWTLPPSLQTIYVPDISWPNMTAEEQRRLRAALDAMSAHEHGHIAIAERLVSSLPEEHFRVLRFGSIQDEVTKRKRAHEAAIQTQQDDYDALTHHGATQVLGPRRGFPGGPNTGFDCPRAQ